MFDGCQLDQIERPTANLTRVLIVDDEPFTIDMLQTFLEINGYEIFSALNGEDGLVLVQVEQPDIMILDLMLPDIEGYEVCQRLRSVPDTSALPILILSARAEASSRERAIKAGADGYLTKPVQFAELLSELTRMQSLRREKPAEPAPAEIPPTTVVTPAPVVPPAQVVPPAAAPLTPPTPPVPPTTTTNNPSKADPPKTEAIPSKSDKPNPLL